MKSIQLIKTSGDVIGTAGGYKLVDQEGKLLTNPQQVNITQKNDQGQDISVATGDYDWRLTTQHYNSGKVVQDGLYITYGLTKLTITDNKYLALFTTDDDGKNPYINELSAQLSGNGDLLIASSEDGQSITLANPNNDFTGKTTVKANGYLIMGAHNTLGKTKEVELEENAVLEMSTHSQTIGKLTTASGAMINAEGPGKLTLSNGGEVGGENTFQGNGSLILEGGTLKTAGANKGYKGEVTLKEGTTANLTSVNGLGLGKLNNSGTVNLNNARDGAMSIGLSGSGTLNLNSSETELTGNNSAFNGKVNIDSASHLTMTSSESAGASAVNNQGLLTLAWANDGDFAGKIAGNGTVEKTKSGSLNLNTHGEWTGPTLVKEGSLVMGDSDHPVSLASSKVAVSSSARLAGYGSLKGDLENSGELSIGSPQGAFSSFLVEGNYEGKNGLVSFKTKLGDDSSPTDKLVIKGNTAGTTRVAVRNIGGAGARTNSGIELIEVLGSSDGKFVQEGRTVAGAYDYVLVQDASSKNWYLRTRDSLVRPETGSYIANEQIAQAAFVTRLHDRLGETRYIDAFTGEQKTTGLWLRQFGKYNSFKTADNKTKTRTNLYVAHLGGDIAAWAGEENTQRFQLGWMAGYAHARSTSHALATGYRSVGKTNGYSIGLYGTWFADRNTHEGFYADAWVNYNWFKNEVSPQSSAKEKYYSKGFTGSLELGYTQKIGELPYGSDKVSWYVQPQAQVIWSGVNTHRFKDANGTRIRPIGKGNVMSRLGARVFVNNGDSAVMAGSGAVQFFLEANWIHNTRGYGVSLDTDTVRQAGGRNLAEVKFGGEGKVNKSVHLWANVGAQFGTKSYKSLTGMIGAKYVF